MFGSGLTFRALVLEKVSASYCQRCVFGTLLEIVVSDRKLATSNKATEVQSVFSQLSASCIPLAVKRRGLLPGASCCVIPVGNRTFTSFGTVQGEEDCMLRFPEYQ